MQNIVDIFKQIQNTSGKNDKEAIIKLNADNELFKQVLIFMLSDGIVTGISKAKINKKLNFSICTREFTYLSEVLDYLKENNTGRDVDIANVQRFIEGKPEDTHEFLRQLFTKSYRGGFDYKTANRAAPGLIKKWEVQLGTPIDKCKLKDGELFFISRKLNGNRCSYYDGKLISRQGKPFTGLQHILNDINTLRYEDYFIDGELIRKNVDGISDNENFRLGTGIANSDAEDKSELELVVFDIFPGIELDLKPELRTTYKDRLKRLENLEDDIKSMGIQNLKVVERYYQGTDKSEIDKWLQYAVDHDYEGIMVNTDSPYECKRVKTLMKVKRFYTMDLEIIGIEEGDGRLKGNFGAFVVDYKGNKVNVGSGYTDEQRAYFWEHKDELIGRVVEVKYKEISKNKDTGLESLQFPIYICLRNLGKEVSYN